MQHFLFLIVLVLYFTSCANQNDVNWISADVVVTESSGRVTFDRLDDKSEIKLHQVATVKDIKLRRLKLGNLHEYGNVSSYLIAGTGFVNGSQVILIDENMDAAFSYDEVYVLPLLQMADTIEYDPLFSYPTDYSKEISITYDHNVKGETYSIPLSLRISLYTKYNEEQGELCYTDKIVGTFTRQYVYNYLEGDVSLEVTIGERLPWQLINFKILGNGLTQNADKCDPISFPGSNHVISIDSFDVITKRILIREVDRRAEINIKSEGLSNGKIVSSNQMDSEYRLLHFWGSWCEPCIKNMPKLVMLNNEYDNLSLLGICLDNDKESPRKLVKEHDMNWEHMYFSDEEYMQRQIPLTISGYPTYLLLNRENKVLGNFESLDMIYKSLAILD